MPGALGTFFIPVFVCSNLRYNYAHMIEFDEDKQIRRLNDLHKSEEEDLVQLVASKYNI